MSDHFRQFFFVSVFISMINDGQFYAFLVRKLLKICKITVRKKLFLTLSSQMCNFTNFYQFYVILVRKLLKICEITVRKKLFLTLSSQICKFTNF